MTFTYKCANCGTIEIEKNINEPELKECPKCKGNIKRVFKPTNTIWNCSGACGKVG